MTTLITPALAAREMQIDEFSVRRLCLKHGLGMVVGGKKRNGKIVGGRWFLTDLDYERLKTLAKPGFGRPKLKKRRRKSLSTKD